MSDDANPKEAPATHGPNGDLIEWAKSGTGLPRELMSTPGGFLWWYLDVVDENGSGMVVIWSFGLPFLPGYIDACRRNRPQLPANRPSLNVAVYRQGNPDFYLLKEFDGDDADWNLRADGDDWRFGNSIIESTVDGNQRTLRLRLRLDVPHLDSRTDIDFVASGPGIHRSGEVHDPSARSFVPDTRHNWTPLLCNQSASATVDIGGEIRRLSGRVYHDRNGGFAPLHQLGIRHWSWGRIALPQRELIYYVLDGRDDTTQTLLLTVDSAGCIRRLDGAALIRRGSQTNRGGLQWWSSMTVAVDGRPWLDIEHRDVVDSGPFYLRAILTATDQRGRRSRGVAEFCEPDRIDRRRHRPLVRMRVAHPEDNNSMWLPLFCGPRRGRIRRMLRSLLPDTGGPS